MPYKEDELFFCSFSPSDIQVDKTLLQAKVANITVGGVLGSIVKSLHA